MSRKVTFFILGLISAVAAYIIYPSLPAFVDLIMTEKVPREYTRILQNSDLVAIAGFTSVFGLSFFLLYLIFPTFFVWYHLRAAQHAIAKLPVITNIMKRTDKKTFFSQMKGLGYIEELAISYGPYLIQGPEEEVSAEILKNARILKRSGKNAKPEKLTISPVKATVPAEVIFNVDNLMADHLLLGFFSIFSRIMIGAGVVCMGLSLISFTIVQGKEGTTLLLTLLPGITAFLYFLTSAIIMAGFSNLADLILRQKARSVPRMINDVFHQNAWQQDINNIQDHLNDMSSTEQLESILTRSLEKPMKEISKAVKALAVDQETKLDNLMAKTLAGFTDTMANKSSSDMTSLSQTLKDTAQAADQMKKHFTEANSQFARQMEKQTTAISKHLTEMQKVLSTSEKTTQKGTEKLMSSVAAEIEGTYDRLGKFMETSLSKLEEKQESLENAVNDKNSILKDLHNSAKDMGIISNASGMLLERFISLSTELDIVLKNIQENGIGRTTGGDGKREKLKLAMMNLQKANSDRLDKLPDM